MDKPLRFTPEMIEMVEKIRVYRGLPSFTSVIHLAVIELTRKEFPSYLGTKMPGEDPVSGYNQKKKIKIEALRQEQLKLVEALGGELCVNESTGVETCKYYTYTGRKRYQQEVSLSMLSTDIVKTQHQPSKEAVLKLQQEGKTEY